MQNSMKDILKPFIFGLLTLVFSISSFGSDKYSDQSADSTTRRAAMTIGYRNGEFSAVNVDADTPVLISGSSSGQSRQFFIATGDAAKNLTKQKVKELEVPAPTFVPVVDGKTGSVTGTLTELVPNSGIFITSRHVLQNHITPILKSGNQTVNLVEQQSNFQIYEFRQNDKLLDVLLLVQKDRTSSFRLSDLNIWADKVEVGHLFLTYQVGRIEEKPTKQVSRGKVSVLGREEFYLPFGSDNFTSLWSSGSVVYTAKANDVLSGNMSSGIGGLSQCIIPAGTDAFTGNIRPALVRVLSAQTILSAQSQPVSLDKVLNEPPFQTPGCNNIGGVTGKDGGG